MKEIIISILEKGKNSPHVSRFYEICTNMSAAQLCISKNIPIRNDMMRKLGCSLKDLAGDCVADLFESKNNLFFQFNNYFGKIINQLTQMHDDEITALLASQIRNITNQYIAELQQDFGNIFLKVRKALRVYIERNKNYYLSIKINNEILIHTNHHTKIDREQPLYPTSELLSDLFMKDFEYYYTSEIVDNIFEIVNSQDTYCKAVKLTDLFEVARLFYEKRMSDHA